MTVIKKQGVYSIKNTNTGKRYIGSSVDIRGRWQSHKLLLRTNKHHSAKLQNSYNKHGADAFVWEIIEEVALKDDMKDVEQRWLDHYDACKGGYNIRAKTNDMTQIYGTSQHLGRKHSDEMKAKVSKAHKGRKHTDESRKNMSEAHKGFKRSPATAEKFGQMMREMWARHHEANKEKETAVIHDYLNDRALTVKAIAEKYGRTSTWLYAVLDRNDIARQRPFRIVNSWSMGLKMSEDFCRKISEARKGKNTGPRTWIHTEAQKEKAREQVRALWQNPEYVARQMESRRKIVGMGSWNKGLVRSQEIRDKISKAKLGKPMKPRKAKA